MTLILFCFLLLCLSANAWRIVLLDSGYDNDADNTHYRYELTDASASSVTEAVIAVPTCGEVSLANYNSDDFSVDGLKWPANIPTVSGGQFIVTVSGFVKSGLISYGITTTDSTMSGMVKGPLCQSIPVLSCNAGDTYSASCGGRVVLSAQNTVNAITYLWEISESNVVIHQQHSSEPTVLIPMLCSREIVVSLAVTGPEGQSQNCISYINVEAVEVPKLLGLYAEDVSVDCDDIPAPSLVTATAACGLPPVVIYSEQNGDSGPTWHKLDRTWSAVDDCGLQVEWVQHITVNDVVAPRLVGVPEDESVACHVVPQPCEVVAYDNCDLSVHVSETETQVQGSCPGTYKIIRSWTATDAAGNTVSDVQTVYVEDLEAPRLVGVPENMNIHCNNLPGMPVVTAIDNCAGDPTVTVSESRVDTISPPSDFRYSVIRIFSATDKCGNVGEHQWTIEIDDQVAPVISGVDPDKTVNCAEIPPPCEVAVEDNCDASVSVVLVESNLEGSCPNTYTITRVWTAVDGNGMTGEETQVIHVVDTESPKWTSSIAPEIFATCDFVPVIDLDATDVCGGVTVLKSTEQIDGSSDVHYTLVHTWVATDECGLTSTKKQTIHVEDATPPSLSGLPSAFVEESCTATINDPLVVATDNCPDCDVDLDVVEVQHPGLCTHSYILERTWTATDCGGLAVSSVQSISIKDTEAPKLVGITGHLIVPVGQVPAAPIVTATDNCDDTTPVTPTESQEPGTCLFEYSIIRTWHASDDCGNIATHTQTVDVIDNQVPVFDFQVEDVEVSCNSIPAASLTASDNSLEVIVVDVQEKTVEGTCPDDYELIRTFTAQDVCGNVVSQEQTIWVNDAEPPIILTGADYAPVVIVSSFQVPSAKVATDLCDPYVAVETSDASSPTDCPSEYSVVYTWTATDRCGNTAVPLVQTVVLLDSSTPTFSELEQNTTVQCDAIPTATIVTATDSGMVSTDVVYTEATDLGDCSDNYDLIRTWSTMDCIGNTATHQCTVTVIDTVPPTLTSPPDDEQVSCANIPPGSADQVSASDNCYSTLPVEYSEDFIGRDLNPGSYAIVRTWKAEDACSGEVVQEQVITVLDTYNPSIQGVPGDIVINCEDSFPDAPTVTCWDDCDGDLGEASFAVTDESLDSCVDGVYAVVVRTWTCSDSSQNPVSDSQTITMENTGGQLSIVPPPHEIISCNDDLPVITPDVVADECLPAANSFGSYTIVPLTRTIPGTTPNDYRVVHSWTVTDSCGNAVSSEQTVTVVDSEAPVLLTPPPYGNVACGSDLTRPSLTATDNCDDDAAVSGETETTPGSCTDRYTITHTWSTNDVSGNSGTDVSTSFVVDDSEVPTFSIPEATITISYVDLPSYPKLHLNPVDNCDPNPTSTCTRDKTEGSCSHTYTLIDTCVVSDRCSNEDSVSRTINVIDDVPPQIGGADPEDATYECPHAPPPAPQRTSEVGINVEYTQATISQACANTYTVERTWVAEDCVHNKATVTQTLVMQDTNPPVFSVIPGDVTRDCPFCVEDEQNQNTVTATDACDPSVFVSEVVETLTEDLGADVVKIYIRTWTARDICLNVATATQTITVVDTTPPVLQNVPDQSSATSTINPSEVPSIPTTVSCFDDCDVTTVSFTQTTEASDICASTYNLIREWLCVDSTGHVDSEARTIYIADTTPPVLHNGGSQLPFDVVITCTTTPEGVCVPDNLELPPSITATDNVDSVAPVTFSQSRVEGVDNEHYTLIRSWHSEDGCHNGVDHTHSLTVAPCAEERLIPTVPCSITVECDSPPTAAEDDVITSQVQLQVKMEDVVITFTRETFPGTCDGSYKILRTWSAGDSSGNSISAFQSVTVIDTGFPVFTPVMNQFSTIECDDPILDGPATVTASDNCDAVVTVQYGEVTITNEHVGGAYILVRTWTSSDSCGNSAEQWRTISVEDTVPPVFTVQPPSIIVNVMPCEHPCEFDMGGENIEVEDECGSSTYKCEPDWDIQMCTTIRHVHCIATDTAGNEGVYDFAHTYNDVSPPTLSAPPAHVSIDCENDEPPLDTVTVSEPCGVSYSASSMADYTEFNGLDIIVRTWSVTDECGHVASVVQTITLLDNTPPVLYHIPESVTVSCANPDTPDDVLADDNCGDDVTLVSTVLKSDGDCMHNYTLVKTWVATDASGRTTSDSQTITVVDNVAPNLTGLPSVDHITVDTTCDLIPPVADVLVNDDCDYALDFVLDQQTVTENLPSHISTRLIRTWTSQDACENSAEFVQTVNIVVDIVAPVLGNLPFDLSVDCLGDVHTDDPTVTDNCEVGLTVSKAEHRENEDCLNSYDIVRRWSVTDSFGNVAHVDQTVFVTDLLAPTLIGVPDHVTSSCSDLPGVAIVNSVDQCGQESTVAHSSSSPDNAEWLNVIVNEWTATDECGNEGVDSQTVYVADVTDPSFSSTMPVDVDLNCEDPIPSTPVVEASDDCNDGVDVTSSFVDEHDCSNGFRRTTTFVATDATGNFVHAVWLITVEDNTNPYFDNFDAVALGLVDSTHQCNDPPIVEIDVMDDCDDVVVLLTKDVSIGNIDHASFLPHFREIIERTYSAQDTCGNEVEHKFTITVIDDIAPVLSGTPEDLSVPCDDENLVLFDNHDVLASDECTSATVTDTSSVTPGTCTEEYSKSYTYTACDENGNCVAETFIATVEDLFPPVLANVPVWDDDEFECDSLPGDEHTSMPTANDACGGSLPVHFESQSSDHANGVFTYHINYVWSAVDDCGNFASQTASVKVLDGQPPNLDCPNGVCGDRTVECGSVPPVADVGAVDNCDPQTQPIFTETTESTSCASEYILTRTWTATDSSSNQNSLTQNIIVQNSVPPSLDFGISGAPVNIVVDCLSVPDVPSPTAAHECEVVFPEYLQTENNGFCPSRYTLTRVWTVTDCVGLTDSHTQVITVDDVTPPVLSLYPLPATVQIDDIKSTWPGTLTATDNCDGVTSVAFSQTKEPGTCKHNFELIRQWTVEDLCGNVDVHHQTVEVIDTIPPVLSGIPPETYVEYDDLGDLAEASTNGVSGVDNSKTVGTVHVSESTVEGVCDTEYKLIRTWTLSDACGNSVDDEQIINVVDTSPPVINEPEDETVECDAVPPPCEVTVNSVPGHPDSSLVVQESEVTIQGNHEFHYHIVRSWFVKDCADNVAEHEQTIWVQDTVGPTFTKIYEDTVTDCDCETDSELFQIDALDNCDGVYSDIAPVVTRYSSDISVDFFAVHREWTVLDTSGNSNHYVQIVTVQDVTPPVWCEDDESLPNTMYYEQCDSVPPAPELKATDDCDPAVSVSFTEETIGGECNHNYKVVRVWTATDRSGNLISHTTEIAVSDSMPPTLINTAEKLCLWPANNMVAVYNRASETLIDVMDNCGPVETTIASCNATDGTPNACAYNAVQDILYVKISANSQTTGRTFKVVSSVKDECDNVRNNAIKKIWVIPNKETYDEAIVVGDCSGTGADHYISAIPSF